MIRSRPLLVLGLTWPELSIILYETNFFGHQEWVESTSYVILASTALQLRCIKTYSVDSRIPPVISFRFCHLLSTTMI